MNLASHAREIFESSEADEKRQLLDLVFQNLQLKDGSLSLSVREPFLTMMEYKKRPEEWGRLDSNQRRRESGDLQSVGIQCGTTHNNIYPSNNQPVLSLRELKKIVANWQF